MTFPRKALRFKCKMKADEYKVFNGFCFHNIYKDVYKDKFERNALLTIVSLSKWVSFRMRYTHRNISRGTIE